MEVRRRAVTAVGQLYHSSGELSIQEPQSSKAVDEPSGGLLFEVVLRTGQRERWRAIAVEYIRK